MAGDLRERQKAEGKRQNVAIQPGGTWTQSYGYDTVRRLQTLGSPAGTFTYTFNGPGNVWTNLALPPSGSHLARGLDNVARLASTKLLNSGGGTLNSHAYLYSLANQRTRQTRTAERQKAEGRRQKVTDQPKGGRTLGHNVFEQKAAEETEEGKRNVSVASVFFCSNPTAGPEAPYSYDANGNLIGKGSMTFQYDGENRLITVTQPGAFQSQFAYDAIGRLRIRWESAWAGYYWSGVSTTVYIYDGMQVIQERDNFGNPVVAYTRGSDVGGGLGSAGGIGGLLARSIGYSGGTWSTHHFYHADGGGNVTYLMDASQGLAASYIHGPFGDLRGTNGTFAADNLYRYSSKHFHTNSALHYYGFRFYDYNSQRWLNRDPIAERGGLNLYGFVGNDPANNTDSLGELEAGPSKPIKPLPGPTIILNFCSDKSASLDNRTVNNWVSGLQRAINYCTSRKYIAPGLTITANKVNATLDKPRSGNYYSNADAIAALQKCSQGPGISVVATMLPFNNVDVVGEGFEGIGIIANWRDLNPVGFAHEVGHVIGYDEGNIDGGVHSSSKANIMNPAQQLMALPDQYWCRRIARAAIGGAGPTRPPGTGGPTRVPE